MDQRSERLSQGVNLVPDRPTKPFLVDDLRRKHESYYYDESSARVMMVECQGRSLRLIMPEYAPPVSVRVTASAGNLLFLIGEQDDMENNGRIIEGGDGVAMIARKHENQDDTYWVFVWHNLFPSSLRYL